MTFWSTPMPDSIDPNVLAAAIAGALGQQSTSTSTDGEKTGDTGTDGEKTGDTGTSTSTDGEKTGDAGTDAGTGTGSDGEKTGDEKTGTDGETGAEPTEAQLAAMLETMDLSALGKLSPAFQERLNAAFAERANRAARKAAGATGDASEEVATLREQIEALTAARHTDLITIAVERAAVAADLKPEKLPYLARLVDVNPATAIKDGKVDAEAVAAAVKAVLDGNPEWLRGAGGSTGPTGTSVGAGPRDVNQTVERPKTIAEAIAQRAAAAAR